MMRIDKYIWCIRIFKTRSLATKACNEGKVLLNNNNVKPGKIIKENDIISVKTIPIWRLFKVLDFPKSRINAKLVSDYAVEITSEDDLLKLKEYQNINKENKYLGIKGRPTKKDRRNINKLKDFNAK
tara:strand:- start:220 stop:600 length:381 start_codon:yes stop_codon:yes gene_type:complete